MASGRWAGAGRGLALLGLVAVLGGLTGASAGCATDQSLVLVGGKTVDQQTIDADPLAVLPGGALVLGRLDAEALFATPLGAKVGGIANNLLPLGAESNFLPSRDVKRIVAAAYAMQGADTCAILQGNFDVTSIRAAAQRQATTPSGATIVRTSYLGNEIYTVSNIGFVPLTAHTILSGTETAMRRALDRLAAGTLSHSLEPWMDELLATQNASFVAVGNLSGQGVVEAAGANIPFLAGLRLVRVLGNFKDPGTNVVGSLTYRDDASATQAVQVIGQLQQVTSFTSLLSMLGLAPRIPPITVAQQASDVAFAVSIDTSTAATLLDLAVQLTQPTTARR